MTVWTFYYLRGRKGPWVDAEYWNRLMPTPYATFTLDTETVSPLDMPVMKEAGAEIMDEVAPDA